MAPVIISLGRLCQRAFQTCANFIEISKRDQRATHIEGNINLKFSYLVPLRKVVEPLQRRPEIAGSLAQCVRLHGLVAGKPPVFDRFVP